MNAVTVHSGTGRAPSVALLRFHVPSLTRFLRGPWEDATDALFMDEGTGVKERAQDQQLLRASWVPTLTIYHHGACFLPSGTRLGVQETQAPVAGPCREGPTLGHKWERMFQAGHLLLLRVQNQGDPSFAPGAWKGATCPGGGRSQSQAETPGPLSSFQVLLRGQRLILVTADSWLERVTGVGPAGMRLWAEISLTFTLLRLSDRHRQKLKIKAA